MSPFLLTRTLPEDATGRGAARRCAARPDRARPKTLPPKWFYDARGSELFEEITRLPEYYPTRAEREILVARAAEIAAATGARTLVELGSGSSEKTRHLLDALPGLHSYVPVDVSESALAGAAEALLAERPGPRRARADRRLHGGLELPDDARAAAGGVPRRHDRQPAARRARGVPARPSARCSRPATRCCSARTWSRTSRCWSPPTTTRPG